VSPTPDWWTRSCEKGSRGWVERPLRGPSGPRGVPAATPSRWGCQCERQGACSRSLAFTTAGTSDGA
jgi:hypothetical protein